MQQNIK